MISAIQLGFRQRVAYRMELLTAMISSVVVAGLAASIWGALMREVELVGGLDARSMSTYVVVAWLVGGAATSRVDRELGERYRSGRMAHDLLRPIDLHAWTTGVDLGRALCTLLITGVPAAVVVSAFFWVDPPASPLLWALFAASVLCAVALSTQVALLAGSLVFRTHNADGAVSVRIVITSLLAGTVVPFAALPSDLAAVLSWLPFAGMAHTPAMIFTGQWSAVQCLGAVALQLAWLLALAAVARTAWTRSQRALVVAGG